MGKKLSDTKITISLRKHQKVLKEKTEEYRDPVKIMQNVQQAKTFKTTPHQAAPSFEPEENNIEKSN